LGSLTAYWYIKQIDTIGNAQGRKGNNAMNQDLEAKRKAFQERQKRALEKLKKQPTTVQPAGDKVEDGRRPGDQTHD
jgi:hypothetical protein